MPAQLKNTLEAPRDRSRETSYIDPDFVEALSRNEALNDPEEIEAVMAN